MKACLSSVIFSAFVMGCGGSPAKTDGSMQRADSAPNEDASVELADGAPVEDASIDDSGPPSGGDHALSFYHYRSMDAGAIETEPMETQPSGSTMIVSIGRGDIGAFELPTDNKNSAPFQQLGTTHRYTRWQTSGTAVYALPSMTGGAHYIVRTTNKDLGFGEFDEITLAAIEVVKGSRIQDYQWNEVVSGPLTSASVRTTGSATLVAFWFGDGYFYNPPLPQTAIPNNGFVVVESNTQEVNGFVQCAVAVKNVAAAGAYDVTWTAMPEQGAQMWLVAVQ